MKTTGQTLDRTLWTRNVAAGIEEWQWPKRSDEQWQQGMLLLEGLRRQRYGAENDVVEAKSEWDQKLALLHSFTSSIVRLGRVHYSGHRERVLDYVKPDAKSRVSIVAAAERLAEVWRQLDEDWVPRENVTLESWEELLGQCTQLRRGSMAAEVKLLLADVEEEKSAAELEADCVAWYAMATALFDEGTVTGALIRTSIPTPATQPPPGEAEITSLTKSAGGRLRAEFEAKHGTRFTLWQQAPGQPEFVAVVRETKERFVDLTGQVAGEHRFKLEAHNSRGTGPMSKEVVIQLEAADVAAA